MLTGRCIKGLATLLLAIMLLMGMAQAGSLGDLTGSLFSGSASGVTVPDADALFGAVVESGPVNIPNLMTGRYDMYKPVSADAINAYLGQMTALGFSASQGQENGVNQWVFTSGDAVVILLYGAGEMQAVVCYKDGIAYSKSAAGNVTGGGYTSVSANAPLNTVTVKIDGVETTFELNAAYDQYAQYAAQYMQEAGAMMPSTGNISKQFVHKDVRGQPDSYLTLSFSMNMRPGTVIQSSNYDSDRYGLCGITYEIVSSLPNLPTMEERMAGKIPAYQSAFMINANYSSADEFFNPTSTVMLWPGNSSFTIFCDSMSEDGYTYAGRFEGHLVHCISGNTMEMTDGVFKFDFK